MYDNMEFMSTPPRRPASSAVSQFGGGSCRVSSARRTAVPTSTLIRMFSDSDRGCSAPTAINKRTTNSVVVQTVVGMGEVSLLQALVGADNLPGVITASHARHLDVHHHLCVQMLNGVISEETRQRAALMEFEKEFLQEIQLRAQLKHRSAESTEEPCTPTASSWLPSANRVKPLLPITNIASPLRNASLTPHSPSPTAALNASFKDEEDVEKLRDRLLLLENRVRTVTRAHSIAASPTNPLAMSFSRSFAVRSVSTAQHHNTTWISDVEDSMRREISCSEHTSWELMRRTEQLADAERRVRSASRVMLHAPFTSYRPKIPIQHSLAGEEYLRRWILVETLQHYEDWMTQLQQHENDVRNAIEDAYDDTIHRLYSSVFLPHFETEATRLETLLRAERERSAEQLMYADSVYTTLKLKIIVDEETALRAVIQQTALDELRTLHMVVVELVELQGVHARARRLEGELYRQGRRRQVEVGYLVSKLPRDGVIHPDPVAVAGLITSQASFHAASIRDASSPQLPQIASGTFGGSIRDASFRSYPSLARRPTTGSPRQYDSPHNVQHTDSAFYTGV